MEIKETKYIINDFFCFGFACNFTVFYTFEVCILVFFMKYLIIIDIFTEINLNFLKELKIDIYK